MNCLFADSAPPPPPPPGGNQLVPKTSLHRFSSMDQLFRARGTVRRRRNNWGSRTVDEYDIDMKVGEGMYGYVHA